MNHETVVTVLYSAGFLSFPDEWPSEPLVRPFNSGGGYIGDMLESIGWEKSKFKEQNKTWIQYTNGFQFIGHRDFFERPPSPCYYRFLTDCYN